MKPRRHALIALVAVAAAAAALLTAVPCLAVALETRGSAVSRALTYLHARQTLAGGFRVSSTAEQPHMTPWCIMAISAAGQQPTAWRKPGGRTPIAYMQSLDLARIATSMTGGAANAPAFYAKIILAYDAAGQRTLIARAGSKRIDLVTSLLAFQEGSGRFSANGAEVNTTTWAILALKAASRASTQRARAVAWLRAHPAANGGFSWNQGGTPDTDSTAAAIQALRAGGVSATAPVIRDALAYLHRQQRSNGGFVSGAFSSSTSTESTALAVQAIVAAGQRPASTAWRVAGKGPLDYIRARQAPSGLFYHFGTIASAPLLTTSQAITALQQQPLPL